MTRPLQVYLDDADLDRLEAWARERSAYDDELDAVLCQDRAEPLKPAWLARLVQWLELSARLVARGQPCAPARSARRACCRGSARDPPRSRRTAPAPRRPVRSWSTNRVESLPCRPFYRTLPRGRSSDRRGSETSRRERMSHAHPTPRRVRARRVPATSRLSFSNASQRGTGKKPQSGTADRRSSGMTRAHCSSRSATSSGVSR